MKLQALKFSILGLIAILIIIVYNFPSRETSLGTAFARVLPLTGEMGELASQHEAARQTTDSTAESFQTYLPIILSTEASDVELKSAWTEDITGSPRFVFLGGDTVAYLASGSNIRDVPVQVDINWTQMGPCGTTLVYSDTVSLDPGTWEISHPSLAPDCIGVYTNTVQITENVYRSSLSTRYVVSQYIQGFDRCRLPSIEQMQTWWNNSPYSVFNIYLGGISFACSDDLVDPTWLQEAAQQGWSFIPTWVGPQAPCSGFTHRMSSNSATAYQEGREEAEAAVERASLLGLMGEQIIYYDIEGYPSSCRSTVESFMRGWSARLHELGVKAGAYGSPCRSYISDWKDNDPNLEPDKVWIAYWYQPYYYDPQATVWGEICGLTDDLWSNHQRIRQYTGGHEEVWGGASMVIDSNAVDVNVSVLQGAIPGVGEENANSGKQFPQIRDMELLTMDYGWILGGESVFWTEDRGVTWKNITSKIDGGAHILATTFLDLHQGWIVAQSNTPGNPTELSVWVTVDSGLTWVEHPLPLPNDGINLPVGAACLEFIDAQNGWISLKLQSGSSFSLGRLFSTQDGGRSWQERSIPLGEPVKFISTQRGWTAGGPAGDNLYRTTDGGDTWQAQQLPLQVSLSHEQVLVGLPGFENERDGVLPVTVTGSANSRLDMYETQDGGDTWSLATSTELDQGFGPAEKLPFSHIDGGRWWFVSPGSDRLYTAADPLQDATQVAPMGLPRGVIALDFHTDRIGWALAQDGACRGFKPRAGDDIPTDFDPLQCMMSTHLFKTENGGSTWVEITPLD